MIKDIPFVFHGSSDSLDVDIIYIFKELPSIKECYQFCNEKKENRNIITIRDGLVYECFKGTPDAINNQIYDTYSLHKQEYPCPISFKIERNVPLKFVRSLRQLLGIIGKQRNYYRDLVKDSLRSLDYFKRLDTFSSLDLTKIFSMDEKDLNKIYDIKSITFQVAQTVAQADGIELYSKKAVVEFDNRLKPFMYRDYEYLKISDNLNILNEYRDKIKDALSVCKCNIKGNLCIFSLDKNVKLNNFTKQCRGMVIDMGKERCIGYPFEYLDTKSNRDINLENTIGIPFKDFEYHYQNFFLCFGHEGEYLFSKIDTFDVPEGQYMDKKILNLLDSDYYYIFSYLKNQLYLVGMRHKYSFLFVPFDSLQKFARSLSLLGLDYQKLDENLDHQEYLVNIKGKLIKLKVEK